MSALEPVTKPAGGDKEYGISRQNMAVADVEMTRQGCNPIDGKQGGQRGERATASEHDAHAICPRALPTRAESRQQAGAQQEQQGKGRLHQKSVGKETHPPLHAVFAVQEGAALLGEIDHKAQAIEPGLGEEMPGLAEEQERRGRAHAGQNPTPAVVEVGFQLQTGGKRTEPEFVEQPDGHPRDQSVHAG